MNAQRIERMRLELRWALPVLSAEGWTHEELSMISPAIRRAIQSKDEAMLQCWAGWIASKVDMSEGACVAILPGLTEAEAEAARRRPGHG